MIITDEKTIAKIRRIASKDILLNGMVAILRRAKLTELTTIGGFAAHIKRNGFKIEYLDALINQFAKTGMTEKAKELKVIREELLGTLKSTQKIKNSG